jgi:transcriptional regulator with XRE-family HTH domain
MGFIYIMGMETILQPAELRKVVAYNIKSRRAELGLTQCDMAEKLRISQPHVSAMENGASCPNVEMLARLAAVLQIFPAVLVAEGSL